MIVTLHSPKEFLAPEPVTPEAIAELNPRQQKVLHYLKEHDYITAGDYAKLMKSPLRTAYEDLRGLVEKGFLVMRGERRGRRYELR